MHSSNTHLVPVVAITKEVLRHVGGACPVSIVFLLVVLLLIFFAQLFLLVQVLLLVELLLVFIFVLLKLFIFLKLVVFFQLLVRGMSFFLLVFFVLGGLVNAVAAYVYK